MQRQLWGSACQECIASHAWCPVPTGCRESGSCTGNQDWLGCNSAAGTVQLPSHMATSSRRLGAQPDLSSAAAGALSAVLLWRALSVASLERWACQHGWRLVPGVGVQQVPGAAASDCSQALAAKALCHFRVAGVALCSVSSAAVAATCDKMLYFQRQSRQPVTFNMPAFGRYLMCGAPPCRMWLAGRRRRLPRRSGSPRPRQQGRLYRTASGGHPSGSSTAATGSSMLYLQTQLRRQLLVSGLASGIMPNDAVCHDLQGVARGPAMGHAS